MLTKKESIILKMAANGCTAKQMARNINVAEGTIRHHLGNIRSKLDAENTAHAVYLFYGQRDRAA